MEKAVNQAPKFKPKFGKIKNIVGILSGKGGVGKSTVTGIAAVRLKKMGFKVGVLDADITGPSMPRFFGIQNANTGWLPTETEGEFMMAPVESRLGIPVMSMNFMLEKEETPVMWRGPILSQVLDQMFTETQWGELDYLLIDMPPGTGDVAITVMSQIPVDYFIMVSSPQDMVTMIVNKLKNMAKELEVPVKGVVQNMAYFKCDSCNKKHHIFSSNSPEEIALSMGLDLIAELPLDMEFTKNLERGTAEQYAWDNEEYAPLGKSFENDGDYVKAIRKKKIMKSIPIMGLKK